MFICSAFNVLTFEGTDLLLCTELGIIFNTKKICIFFFVDNSMQDPKKRSRASIKSQLFTVRLIKINVVICQKVEVKENRTEFQIPFSIFSFVFITVFINRKEIFRRVRFQNFVFIEDRFSEIAFIT